MKESQAYHGDCTPSSVDLRPALPNSNWLHGLQEFGLLGATCSFIVPKDGRTFKTIAFRVSCDAQYANLFYEEASWPAGCELRDWVFRNKATNVQHVENVSV